ncbi:MAG: sugar ABC transporter substrate-binding protein [Spirochaetaceae bacterium]|jgi:multiple sugar transport system substrate-binding protein|nr:sugar ABC transporter substrate-binding protein [Spirochaetaceae bacterium]
MKRLKRLCVFVLVFGLAASFFAGCKRKQAETDGGDIITLKWALWDYDLTVYYRPLIDAYQAKNPQVRIETVDLGSADYMTVLGTQLSGGADLDVVCVKDIPGYANLVRQNRLEPLSGYIKTKGVDTVLYGGTTEQITVNGEVYALPFRSDFWLIFYNKDLFDAAGVPYPSNDITLDEYDALARRVTRGSGANKTYGAHYHTWRSAVQLFGILDGKNTIVDGTYDFLTPYYERVIKEQNEGIVQNYAALKTSGTHYSGAFFNNQIAMLNMGTWFITTQIDKVKTGESLSKNWGLAKYPHPAGVPAGTTLGTITSIAINRNSKNKDAALDFMRFISGPEGAVILAKLGTIPAIMNQEVINAIASIPGFPGDPESREALQVYRTYLEMPLHEKSADIEIVLNEAHDGIMTGNSTIAQGIKEMNDRVKVILGK